MAVYFRRKPFVVYWNNIPAPYMVERFNALSDRGRLNFEAWFNDRLVSDRSWLVDESTWRFRYRYLPTTRFFSHRLHWPLPLLGRRPDVLVNLYAEPCFLAGWALAKIRGAKTCFWVEKTFNRWVKRSSIKESIKHWLFTNVDAILTVGSDGKRFVERYGTPAERIFFVPHAIDVSHYKNLSDKARQHRGAFRKSLGLKGTTFVYVGRLWWGKGVDYLLEAFAIIQRKSAEHMSLLLVGDGIEEAKLRKRCSDEDIHNVIFAGFHQKPELPSYYAVADVFVFPTLGDPYGLVIDEAMACSLPVISTNAAGEIRDRVEDGVNGYIISPANSKSLAEAMLKLYQDAGLRQRMGKASLSKIVNRTPERWAEDFERIIFDLLDFI